MDQYATADYRQTGGMMYSQYGEYQGLPQEDNSNGGCLNGGCAGESSTGRIFNEGCAGESNTRRNFAGKGYAGDSYAAEDYAAESYAGGGYAEGSYAAGGYAGGGYAEGSYDAEGYAGGSYAEERYAAEDHAGNSYAEECHASGNYFIGNYPVENDDGRSGIAGNYGGEGFAIGGENLPDGFTKCGWMECSPFEEAGRERCQEEYAADQAYRDADMGEYFPAAAPDKEEAMGQMPEETGVEENAAEDYEFEDGALDGLEPEYAEPEYVESGSAGSGGAAPESAGSGSIEPDSTDSASQEGGTDQPETAPAETGLSGDRKRKEHEAAEEKRRAEWEAGQQAKKDAEAAQLARLAAMGDEELAAEAMRRVGADTEKLTRRNMKDCVSEYVQTLCLEDPDFARLAMHPRKTMIRCFRYINRKAREFVEQEMKDNDIKPENGIYGSDVPDGLCYQWAEDYFRDPDPEEDREKEEKFVPKPYAGSRGSKPSSGSSAGRKPSSKNSGRKPGTGGGEEKNSSAGKSARNGKDAGAGKTSAGKAGEKKTEMPADDGQISFMDQLTLEGCFAQEVKAG